MKEVLFKNIRVFSYFGATVTKLPYRNYTREGFALASERSAHISLAPLAWGEHCESWQKCSGVCTR